MKTSKPKHTFCCVEKIGIELQDVTSAKNKQHSSSWTLGRILPLHRISGEKKQHFSPHYPISHFQPTSSEVICLCPFHRWGNWGSFSSDLPEITLLGNSEVGSCIQFCPALKFFSLAFHSPINVHPIPHTHPHHLMPESSCDFQISSGHPASAWALTVVGPTPWWRSLPTPISSSNSFLSTGESQEDFHAPWGRMMRGNPQS